MQLGGGGSRGGDMAGGVVHARFVSPPPDRASGCLFAGKAQGGGRDAGLLGDAGDALTAFFFRSSSSCLLRCSSSSAFKVAFSARSACSLVVMCQYKRDCPELETSQKHPKTPQVLDGLPNALGTFWE